MAHIPTLAIVFTIILRPFVASTVTLEQTIPGDNARVCLGETLKYTCTTVGDGLAWQEGGNDPMVFNSLSDINTTMQGVAFTFLLVDILPGNPYMFISTATIPSVTSAENGLVFSCSEGLVIIPSTIIIKAQPEDCEGTVSCKVNPNPVNEKFTDITVILNNDLVEVMCVVGYIFSFGNESKYVAAGSSLSANFTISKEQGLTYENEEIFTVNAENETGEQSCMFAITKPNQITEIRYEQNCEHLTMTITLTLEWNIPSLILDNCLDANELVWQYKISLDNITSTKQYVRNDPELVVEDLSPSSQYGITIIPVLSDLGISGDPLTTNIVLNANCSLPNDYTAIVVAVVSVAVVSVLAFITCGIITGIFCCWYHNKVKDRQYLLNLSSQSQHETIAELKQMREVKQQQQEELVEMKAQLNETMKVKQQQQEELVETKAELNEVMEVKRQQEEELAKANTKLNQVIEEKRQQKIKLDKMEVKLNEMTEEKQQKEAELKQLVEELKKKDGMLEEVNSKMEHLKQQLKEKDEHINNLESEIKDLKAQMREKDTEIANLQRAVGEVNNRVDANRWCLEMLMEETDIGRVLADKWLLCKDPKRSDIHSRNSEAFSREKQPKLQNVRRNEDKNKN